MDYKTINDYELIYLVNEKNEDAFNIIFKKYENLINKYANYYYNNYKQKGVNKDELNHKMKNIFNKIYKFNFSSTILKSLAMGVTGHAVGKTAFKLVSKSITWIPILGNAVNAVISGSTTAALGAAIINAAEKLDDARRRGKKLDEIIKKLGE